MRKPKNVLVFLFRKKENNEYEYCIFYRKKSKFWQGLSGGVEDNEELIDTVKREVMEETGITVHKIYKLDSISSIPVLDVTGEFTWGNDIYVVYEYSFGVLIGNEQINLSSEHEEYKWVSFDEAYNLLKFDSNKTALFELNERLKRCNVLK